MKTGNAEGKEEKDFFGNLLTPYTLITRKPMVPSEEEIEGNSRARSAKLRSAQRTASLSERPVHPRTGVGGGAHEVGGAEGAAGD